jgi:multisubunit Na+/H+ antiporter MnhC subunit
VSRSTIIIALILTALVIAFLIVVLMTTYHAPPYRGS